MALLESRVDIVSNRLDAMESRTLKKDIGVFGMLGTIIVPIIFV